MPMKEFDVVFSDAQVLEQKLSHIKVRAKVTSGSGSLLITEKTGDSSKPPIPLDVFLSQSSTNASTAVIAIASDVFVQTEALGDIRSDMLRLEDLLWKHHDDARLAELCPKYARRKLPEDIRSLCSDPLSLLEHIRKDQRQFHVEFRDCLHGDLNVTNIAVDSGRTTKGYIFDASGVGSGPAARDLAMLEVSALLHVPAGNLEPMVPACSKYLYDDSFLPNAIGSKTSSDRTINTLSLIREIRTYVNERKYCLQYALCLFDQALIQVGGLAWPSGNKVRDFREAVLLACLIAGWIGRTMPHLVSAVADARSSVEGELP